MKTTRKPHSVIEKWLFFDRDYNRMKIADLLKIDHRAFRHCMERPWNHITIMQMEKIAILLEKDVVEVFWACYKRPLKEMAEKKQLELYLALERQGIR